MTTATAIRELPICFSTPMVKAIGEGCKTQTRRVVTLPKRLQAIGGDLDRAWADLAWGVTPCLQVPCSKDDTVQRLRNPWGWPEPVRLWVKESYVTSFDSHRKGIVVYRDGSARQLLCDYEGEGYPVGLGFDSDLGSPLRDLKFKSGRFMPKWATRTWLEVVGVRAERVQSISDAEVKAEGFLPWIAEDGSRCMTARERFAELWDILNGKRGFIWGRGVAWNLNPWVWVLEFRRLES